MEKDSNSFTCENSKEVAMPRDVMVYFFQELLIVFLSLSKPLRTIHLPQFKAFGDFVHYDNRSLYFA